MENQLICPNCNAVLSNNPIPLHQKMLNLYEKEIHMVLAEISVIPIGCNGQSPNEVAAVQDIIQKTGLIFTPTQYGACIQGGWNEIAPVIFACYEQIQKQSPQGFVRVAIR